MRARPWILASLAGCAYDVDKLYEHGSADAGADTQADASEPALRSDALIASWIGNNPQVTRECIACAEERCANENAACVGDAQCKAYTECLGREPTPAGQMACRAQHAAWVNDPAHVRERDLLGPYGQCVFRLACAAACTDNDNDLWCANQYSFPGSPAESVPLHLYLTDATQQSLAASNVKVKVCDAFDVQCATPLAEGTTDMDGKLDLSLPASFSEAFAGYFEITGGGRYPTLLKLSWNIGVETTQVVGIVAQETFQQALSLIQVESDDERGMMQLRMLGCGGNGVRGVSFTSTNTDARTKTWYIDTLPSLQLTETTRVGSGGIIDVLEGSSTVTAIRAADQVEVGRAVVPVRRKFMTVVVFAPKET